MMQFSRKILLAALTILLLTAGTVYIVSRPQKILVSDEIFRETILPPAPRGFAIVREKPDGGKPRSGRRRRATLSIDRMTITSRADIPAGGETVSEEPSTKFFLLSRDYLVTVDSGQQAVGSKGTQGEPVKKPLSELLPNEYAECKESMYVDDPAYPDIIFRYARCVFHRKKIPESLTAWLEQAFPEPPEDRVAFVGAVGDLMPGRGIERILDRRAGKTGGIARVFTDTLPVLRSNDIMIGNLEGAVTKGSAQAVKTYTFRYDPAILPHLKAAGFTYLMLTNNHSFDYGIEGFSDTLASVRTAGFATSGCGANLAEAGTFWRTTVGRERFSVISCGAYPVERSGFNGERIAAATDAKAGILWESPRVAELVKKEKETGAVVIVNVHGGEEYRTQPSAKQIAFYRALCDAGADAVFGSHPHVLQPIERYGKSVIVYSLGNFLFPGMEDMPGAEESLIVRLGILRGRIVYRELYPARLAGKSVSLVKP